MSLVVNLHNIVLFYNIVEIITFLCLGTCVPVDICIAMLCVLYHQFQCVI